jgi:hypothetical protein
VNNSFEDLVVIKFPICIKKGRDQFIVWKKPFKPTFVAHLYLFNPCELHPKCVGVPSFWHLVKLP